MEVLRRDNKRVTEEEKRKRRRRREAGGTKARMKGYAEYRKGKNKKEDVRKKEIIYNMLGDVYPNWSRGEFE